MQLLQATGLLELSKDLAKIKGPYMNEDGDWWVPVEDVKSFREARNTVVDCLSYDIPYDGTLIYKGQSKTLVCDEHIGEEVGPCCTSTCSRYVLCYHFLENRKW
jgi:hypothetical protein